MEAERALRVATDKQREADAARERKQNARAANKAMDAERADRVAAHGTAPLASPSSKAMKSVSITPRARPDADDRRRRPRPSVLNRVARHRVHQGDEDLRHRLRRRRDALERARSPCPSVIRPPAEGNNSRPGATPEAPQQRSPSWYIAANAARAPQKTGPEAVSPPVHRAAGSRNIGA